MIPFQPYFKKLAECRADVAKKLGVEEKSLRLSMGMSGDYKLAIRNHNCPTLFNPRATLIRCRPGGRQEHQAPKPRRRGRQDGCLPVFGGCG